jgi:hypothetical protein
MKVFAAIYSNDEKRQPGRHGKVKNLYPIFFVRQRIMPIYSIVALH